MCVREGHAPCLDGAASPATGGDVPWKAPAARDVVGLAPDNMKAREMASFSASTARQGIRPEMRPPQRKTLPPRLVARNDVAGYRACEATGGPEA